MGALIALTVEPGEDWKSVEMPDGAAAAEPSQEASALEATVGAAEASGPPPPGQSVSSLILLVLVIQNYRSVLIRCFGKEVYFNFALVRR